MSHFAKLDEHNIVVFVTVGRDEDDGLEETISERTGDRYVQTSFNTHAGKHLLGGTPFRKNFAGIGYTYDPERDAFIPPKPFPSWILDEETCLWNAPVICPENGGLYNWDETNQEWVPVE